MNAANEREYSKKRPAKSQFPVWSPQGKILSFFFLLPKIQPYHIRIKSNFFPKSVPNRVDPSSVHIGLRKCIEPQE